MVEEENEEEEEEEEEDDKIAVHEVVADEDSTAAKCVTAIAE